MTETSCVISMTSHGDTTSGHVGGPVVCCEVKLVDIPEMNYTNADKPAPRGEVRPAALPHSLATPPLLNVMHLLCVMLLQRPGRRRHQPQTSAQLSTSCIPEHLQSTVNVQVCLRGHPCSRPTTFSSAMAQHCHDVGHLYVCRCACGGRLCSRATTRTSSRRERSWTRTAGSTQVGSS